MSCSSSSIKVFATDTAMVRQRTCAREACCSSPPSQDKSCCDDNCLIEIARRDCKHEQHAHLEQSSSSLPSASDEEPCESHLAKAKAAYSEILNNIGCICKVLLSLNMESCCKGSATSLERKASWQSASNRLLSEMRRASSEAGSSNVAAGGSCAGDSCCSPTRKTPQPSIKQELCPNANALTSAGNISLPSLKSTKARECATSDCCSQPPVNTISASIKHSDKRLEPSKTAQPVGTDCCANVAQPQESASESKQECEKGCCSTAQLQNIPPFTAKTDCQRRVLISEGNPEAADSCCGGQDSTDNKCSYVVNKPSVPLDLGSEKIDLEHGLHQIEHLVISVQGMTCTGCETNLLRTLKSTLGTSSIKTSLVLGRAEFDLVTTSTRTAVDVVKSIEKKTGFVCARLSDTGHQIDLVVQNVASFSAIEDLPVGVSDIEVCGSNTVRVSYFPEIIGARDLLGDPLFSSAKLAPLADPPLIASGRAQLWLMMFKTVVSTVLTIPVLVMAWARLPPREVQYGAASLVLASIVQIYIAGPWYISAFKALFFSRLVEVDFLVVLSSSTAYIYSIIAYAFLVSGKPLSTEGFFETSTLLVTLIMLGRLVTTLARQRAVESISIESLQSTTAVLCNLEHGSRVDIDARLLQYGDVFIVLPDSSVVTDGTVLSGISEIDESMITGEATLVTKQAGSPVVAGSINHSGTLTVRLTRLTGDNTIKAIGLMVDEAKSSRAKFQEMADRVASYFVPIILVVTVLVFGIWVGVGKGVREYSTSETCINAMTYAIAALIVSCPCAIGLAVPMVLVIAGGVAAKHGLIFKSAETIEKARKTSHVVFDKTGTLTQGSLTVKNERFPNRDGASLAPMILGLTSNSKHPVSSAIAAHLLAAGTTAVELSEIKSIPGCGIEATWGEDMVRGGNPYWLGIDKLPTIEQVLSQGVTVFCVTVNKGLVAVYGLDDDLQIDTHTVVRQLKLRNIEISIISGDNEESVKSISRQLDIPDSHVRFRCSPADKQAYIKSISSDGKIVMFCGDGTNDAVALAEATIGVHVNGGTDIAKSAADAVLIRSSITGIIILIDLSKAFYQRVVFNFAWSFVYNSFAILLAAGAFPNVRIEPQFAGLGEIVSVLPVIAVGVQLRWAKFTNV